MKNVSEIEVHFETKGIRGELFLFCPLNAGDGKPMNGGGFCEVDDDFLDADAFIISLGHAIEHATGIRMETYE